MLNMGVIRALHKQKWCGGMWTGILLKRVNLCTIEMGMRGVSYVSHVNDFYLECQDIAVQVNKDVIPYLMT